MIRTHHILDKYNSSSFLSYRDKWRAAWRRSPFLSDMRILVIKISSNDWRTGVDFIRICDGKGFWIQSAHRRSSIIRSIISWRGHDRETCWGYAILFSDLWYVECKIITRPVIHYKTNYQFNAVADSSWTVPLFSRYTVREDSRCFLEDIHRETVNDPSGSLNHFVIVHNICSRDAGIWKNGGIPYKRLAVLDITNLSRRPLSTQLCVVKATERVRASLDSWLDGVARRTSFSSNYCRSLDLLCLPSEMHVVVFRKNMFFSQ